jgi:hypothetical protein
MAVRQHNLDFVSSLPHRQAQLLQRPGPEETKKKQQPAMTSEGPAAGMETTTPLLTPYKMGEFNLAHRSVN